MARLKVYRTVIGFHDAYVAAASQKAALAAWGTDRNLFARGIAEPVTDPELAKEALARPGIVIKKLRSTTAEQFAAIANASPKPRQPAAAKARPSKPPSRAALNAAEQALDDASKRYEQQERALAEQEDQLRRQRRELEKTQAREIAQLERKRDSARDIYKQAVEHWEP